MERMGENLLIPCRINFSQTTDRIDNQTTIVDLSHSVQDFRPTSKPCNCKKSKCVKLYCDCFARREHCTEACRCRNCKNSESHEDQRLTAIQACLSRNPHAFQSKIGQRSRSTKGCNCLKSGCFKKYCECFVLGVKCTDDCKCVDCFNNGKKPFSNMDIAMTPKKRRHKHYNNNHISSLESFNGRQLKRVKPCCCCSSNDECDDDDAEYGDDSYEITNYKRHFKDHKIFESNRGLLDKIIDTDPVETIAEFDELNVKPIVLDAVDELIGESDCEKTQYDNLISLAALLIDYDGSNN